MNLDTYNNFAKVYDLFMDNVPYDDWCTYLHQLLMEAGIRDGLVLELGCGTGSMTTRLAKAGYDMIGIDKSLEMLEIAMEKQYENPQGILYLNQDMTSFELYGTVKAIVCVCDSLNYILEEEALEEVFRLANNYLDPKGLFIFDLSMEYKYKDLIGNRTIAENREEASFIWDNYYDEESQENEYELTIFIPEKNGYYKKYEEVHYQRAYDLEKIKELLEKAGMEFVVAYDAFTKDMPKDTSERVYVIARECGKNI